MQLKKTDFFEIPILDFNPVGSLKFFTVQSVKDYDLGKVPDTKGSVYWKDAKGCRGPFMTLYSALEDYKLVIGQRKGIKLNNVIEVDFTNKRRIR